jgi:glycerol kinase
MMCCYPQNLVGGVKTGLHITEVTNASRTLLLNLHTLKWEPSLLEFFGLRESILPKLVSSSEVYGEISSGPLKGVKIGGLIGDQQGALVGNKCFKKGEAKCTYGTGAFLLFCTGSDIVKSAHGLLGTARPVNATQHVSAHSRFSLQIAYQPGPNAKPVYALEGSSKWFFTITFRFTPQRFPAVAVAGSAVKWLRDSMKLISSADEVNDLAKQVPSTGGVYFVTAFSGLLAPYWDPGAAGMLIGGSLLFIQFHYLRLITHLFYRPFFVHNSVPHCPRHLRSERLPDTRRC